MSTEGLQPRWRTAWQGATGSLRARLAQVRSGPSGPLPWALRGAIVASAAGACLLTAAAGDLGLLGLVVALGVAMAAAALPDTPVPLALMAVLVLVWVLGVRSPLSGGDIAWAGGVALLLTAIHLAAGLLAVLPPEARMPRAARARWARRATALAAVCLGVTLLGIGLATGPGPGSRWFTLLAVAGVSAWVLAAYLGTLGLRPSGRKQLPTGTLPE